MISGSLCAVTIHHGAYSSMADAYGALTAWIDDNGYEVIAAPYDIYWKNHQNGVSNVEQWETEIRFPIAKISFFCCNVFYVTSQSMKYIFDAIASHCFD